MLRFPSLGKPEALRCPDFIRRNFAALIAWCVDRFFIPPTKDWDLALADSDWFTKIRTMEQKSTFRSLSRDLLLRSAAACRLDSLALRFLKDGARKRPLVRVVNLHGTASADAAAFKTQLSWVLMHYSIIDFQKFVEMAKLKNGAPTGKPAVLFTFDDGLESNYLVAAPILESMGTRGVFFVIPQFAMSRGQEAKAFFETNVSQRAYPASEPEETWKPMSPEQIADLARRGHTIGNHTFSHPWLSTVPAEQLHWQIVESASVLQSWIGSPPQAFAWTFSWEAISREAWQLAKSHHGFCFTPCPGLVDLSTDEPDLIWRCNAKTRSPEYAYPFVYAGLGDLWWKSRRRRLASMLRRDS
jgi:peptidoglycan/xylan/chitin deacetylase (PgdA/CDA1 family)